MTTEQEHARKKLRENYSERAVDHMLNPRNKRRVPRPDGYAKATTDGGETVEFFIHVRGNVLTEIAFETDGCAATLACASAAAELAANKTLTQAPAAVSARAIIRALDGLPRGNIHCAPFVAEVFHRAVADAWNHRDAPWKSLYRKV